MGGKYAQEVQKRENAPNPIRDLPEEMTLVSEMRSQLSLSSLYWARMNLL